MNKTCADCIHYESCCEWTSKDVIDMTSNAINEGVIEECKHFKDKSRFIELPCAVGDSLYVISQMSDKRILPFINEYEATSIKCGKIKCVVYHEKDGYLKIFKQDDFGKTVFLTREDAEQALKGGAE